MGKGKISVSMMCCRLIDLFQSIKVFEKMKVDYLHIDVMDGNFVSNFGLGTDYIRGLRELTNIPLDLHLMIQNPESKLEWLGIQDTDIVSIHYESTSQVQRTLDLLKKYRCKRFIAISPATPVYVLEDILDDIDGINVLMVNPGFAGQKMVASAIAKVKKIKNYLMENNRKDLILEVDGNITNEYAKELRVLGAEIFVAGSSSIFSELGNSLKERIANLSHAINF